MCINVIRMCVSLIRVCTWACMCMYVFDMCLFMSFTCHCSCIWGASSVDSFSMPTTTTSTPVIAASSAGSTCLWGTCPPQMCTASPPACAHACFPATACRMANGRTVVHALVLVRDELLGQQATKACSQQLGMRQCLHMQLLLLHLVHQLDQHPSAPRLCLRATCQGHSILCRKPLCQSSSTHVHVHMHVHMCVHVHVHRHVHMHVHLCVVIPREPCLRDPWAIRDPWEPGIPYSILTWRSQGSLGQGALMYYITIVIWKCFDINPNELTYSLTFIGWKLFTVFWMLLLAGSRSMLSVLRIGAPGRALGRCQNSSIIYLYPTSSWISMNTSKRSKILSLHIYTN